MSDSDYKKLEVFFLKYKKAYNEFSFLDLTEFEKSILGPEIFQRLDYIRSTFYQLLKLCENPQVEIDLHERLKSALPAYIFNLQSPEPQLAKEYLAKVQGMIKDQYLDPIGKLMTKHSNVLDGNNVKHFIEFATESKIMFDSIVQTKDRPFTMHFRALPSVKNLKTQEVLAKEPDEFSYILLPFITSLNEISNVSKATSDSIDHWAKQRQEMKSNFLSFVKDMANVESSKSQEKNSFNLNLFQVLVLIFTICLIAITDRSTLYLEKRTLESLNINQASEIKNYTGQIDKQAAAIKNQESTISMMEKRIKDQEEIIKRLIPKKKK